MVVEQNHGAQLLRYLRGMVDLPGRPASFHRPGPLPLRPGELCTAILEWAGATRCARGGRMNNMVPPPVLTAAQFKSGYKPIWCPGCGDYTVLGADHQGAGAAAAAAARSGGGVGHRLLVAHSRPTPRATAFTACTAARWPRPPG